VVDSSILDSIFKNAGLRIKKDSLVKFKVCLDIRPVQTGAQHTGTGVYARELAMAIQGLEHGLDIWYLVLANYPLPDLNLPADRLIRVWRPSKPERWHVVCDWFFLQKLLVNKGINLFHSPTLGTVFPTNNLRVISTVLDLIPTLFPEDYATSLDGKWLYRLKLRSICASDGLIAISEATKQDVLKQYQVSAVKISVTYLSVSSIFVPASPTVLNEFRKRLRLPERYILYLGGYSFRKNVTALIQAFSQLRNLRHHVKLVLAGGIKSGLEEQLRSLIAKLGIQEDVVWLGHISERDLPILYSGAEIFVYPSIYEGFGLPVLEAMACGTPVITSNVSSLPEVAGDAAVLVDPHDNMGLTMAMRRILEDSSFHVDLGQKGLARSEAFSWDRCARQTIAVYQQYLS
jgi:glycosyltransferase involved in cell wall biosynthesis